MNTPPVFGDKYRLVWRKIGKNQLGEVRNYATDGKGCRAVKILLDDQIIKKIKMRFVATCWNTSGPQICVSSLFLSIPQNLRGAGIWHEIGHIHYEHAFRADFSNQEHLRTVRISAIKEGRVISEEAVADRFAVAQVGKEAVIDFLIYLLATRPSGGKLGWNEMGGRELEMRIAAIQHYEN